MRLHAEDGILHILSKRRGDAMVRQYRAKTLFRGICARQTNEQIRKSLGISGHQLTRLTSSLYAKLGTKSRKQIREMGMILIDEDDNS